MAKEDPLVFEGVVVETLPGSMFKVKLIASESMQSEMFLIAHLCGKMRKGHIRLCVGDRVTVEVTPYDLTKGRIKYRLK